MKEKCIIIGSGPAGLTAAIYAARADLNPLVFEGKNPGGQLVGTGDVENFPGFPDGINGPMLILEMKKQAKKFGAKLIQKNINKVDFFDPQNLKIFSGDQSFDTQTIIIATGATARWLNLGKNEERFWAKGYSSCATCDGAFYREKKVGVVGGGDSACEEAMFLSKFASEVFLFHRRDELRASKPMQKKVFENKKIKIFWNTIVTNLLGENILEKVELTDTQTDEKKIFSLDGLFMGIGHIPNTKFLKNILDTDENGFLQTKNKTQTKIPGVFVAGDVGDKKYRQAVTAAASGCMAALDVEHFLSK